MGVICRGTAVNGVECGDGEVAVLRAVTIRCTIVVLAVPSHYNCLLTDWLVFRGQ